MCDKIIFEENTYQAKNMHTCHSKTFVPQVAQDRKQGTVHSEEKKIKVDITKAKTKKLCYKY